MGEELSGGELLQDSHIILQPERYRIVEQLVEKPMHISELSRALGQERRLVAYHISYRWKSAGS